MRASHAAAMARDPYPAHCAAALPRGRPAAATARGTHCHGVAVLAMMLAMSSALAESTPIVIAHRGASGYLPEHTLAAKRLAHEQGADYLEQDVVMSRDGVPVVAHDLTLEATTDVATRFPTRARDDGRWYVIDFDWAELATLSVGPRRDPATGKRAWPSRPDTRGQQHRLHTLDDELRLIAELNRASGRTAGIYTEVKSPAFHRRHGIDPTPTILAVLARHGYAARRDPVYLQCFDPQELQRIRDALGSDLKLVQLIGDNAWGESNADYDAMRTPAGLDAIARYADGIGPWIPQVVAFGADGSAASTGLAEQARSRGLAVHPYTIRADQLPAGAPSLAAVHDALFRLAGADGAFSDFPDLTRAALR